MAKSGLKHIDVGNELTKTEWESEESHELVHGSSFPGTPVERQLFYRDDEHKWYIYNGSAWVWLGGGSGSGATTFLQLTDTPASYEGLAGKVAQVKATEDGLEFSAAAGGMEVHGNEYHDPDFEEAGVAASLIASHAAIDDAHHSRYTDAEAAAVAEAEVESHRTTEVHSLAQPPQTHGNEKHSSAFATETQLSTHAALTTGVHGLFTTSLAKGEPSLAQNIGLQATWRMVELSNEIFDTNGEFDSSVKTGITTGQAANKLIDSNASFVAGDVGRNVCNTTDHTYAKVTAVDSPTQLTLDSDIMATGEGYRLYFSTFTAKNAGYYLLVGTVRFQSTVMTGGGFHVQILRNGDTNDTLAYTAAHSARIGSLIIGCLGLTYLDVDDYINLAAAHWTDAVTEITLGGDVNYNQSNLSVFRLH
jgi:hypothetical protein